MTYTILVKITMAYEKLPLDFYIVRPSFQVALYIGSSFCGILMLTSDRCSTLNIVGNVGLAWLSDLLGYRY
jgi:hypothetical protein